MDYEKAYKDALEKARFLRQQAAAGGNPLMANRYEQIFPQLSESEDEKTAREIKEFILYKAGHLLDEATEHRFIKYLEKQKEQKPAEKPNGEMLLDSYSQGYNDGYRHGLIDKNALGTTENNPIDPFDTKLFQDGVKEGRRLEREDMQNPTEWSEEDEKMLGRVLGTYVGYEATVRDGVLTDGDVEILHQCAEERAWLKSRFKSLRPQPHWKPSEEQMMILRWAANGMVDESIAAPEMRAVLRELYNDLKKL